MATAPSGLFGHVLRHFRVAAGLTQHLLAERAQMSVRGVSDLERGVRRTPHRETLTLSRTPCSCRLKSRRP
jgi:transcriptional regulator with XRE-family HTH domain